MTEHLKQRTKKSNE